MAALRSATTPPREQHRGLPRGLIPALTHRAYPLRTSSPRGSHPEVCRLREEVRRLRVGLRPTPGRLREPPWGYYGPCARSSLDGSTGEGPASPDVTRRGAGRASGRTGPDPEDPNKRGPESKIADERSATGRAEGGSILPRRILAQRMRLYIHRASRRSAAPHSHRTRRRGRMKMHAREPRRHARPCGEHPRLGHRARSAKTWMVGTSLTMTAGGGREAARMRGCAQHAWTWALPAR